MRNIWLTATISAFVPGLYWAILGAVGIAESKGFLYKWANSLYIDIPLVLLLWVPSVLILLRWFRPTLPNILSLSVAFWFGFRLILHAFVASELNDGKYAGVSTPGVVIYFFEGFIFGCVFWFLTYREKRT